MSKKMNGMMIFYIDIGQLPPYKAEAFVERCKDNFKNKKLKKNGIECIFIPVRPNSKTRVEFIPTSEEAARWVFGAKTFKPDVEIFEIEEKGDE